MDTDKSFYQILSNGLSKNPLIANVVLGFTQVGLEKLMEVEFQCPCKPGWNQLVSSLFFILPCFFTFISMLIIQKCKRDWRFEPCSKVVFSLVPAVVWVTLLCFDGRYLACAMTTWKGRYVIIDRAPTLKWCDPNVTSSDQMMISSEEFYSYSQVWGIGCLCFICAGLIWYQLTECVNAEEHNQEGRGSAAVEGSDVDGNPESSV